MFVKNARQPRIEEDLSERVFAALPCPALRASLRNVSAAWTSCATVGPEGESSVDHTLMRLALRLDGTATQPPPTANTCASGDDASSNGTARPEDHGQPETLDAGAEIHLLAAIRRDLLEQWRRRDLPVDQERLLALLSSIELHANALIADEAAEERARSARPDAFWLLAEVGHDLRSPLTSILFLSEALRNGQSGSLTELQRHQMGLVYSAGLGLMGVVNDLMSFAQAPRDLDEATAFSIPQTLASVREMIAPMAEAKQIALRFDAHSIDHRVGHPGPLGRVLLNLTTNAIKFTPDGGSVEVLIDSVGSDAVEISVRDTGRGLSEEQRAQLFQTFQKAPGREELFFAPSGLGLSIVRGLLEKMDSQLTIESEVGKGTRFSFVLHLPTPHQDARAPFFYSPLESPPVLDQATVAADLYDGSGTRSLIEDAPPG